MVDCAAMSVHRNAFHSAIRHRGTLAFPRRRALGSAPPATTSKRSPEMPKIGLTKPKRQAGQ
jgi:hypothetical protein